MSRRMTIVGLAALCALALSAISASGASAGTTAFTCLNEQGTGQNTNEDCETNSAGKGKFGHVAITEKTTLQLDKLTNPVLTGKLFGATVELQATGVECVECTAENKEVGGVMEVTGSGGKLKFTGVTAVGLASCNVNGGTITTEKLKFTTTSVTGATLEPETGTLLAKFNITGAGCTVAGENIKVTGKAFASLNGAILTVAVTKASGELQLEEEKAALSGKGTVTAGKPGSGVDHTTALTAA